jgi:hypothetical protein
MTRPFFARDRVTDFELFDRHAEAVVARLKERFAQGEPIDFQVKQTIPLAWSVCVSQTTNAKDIVGRFTLDSATEFLFGSCVHSLSAHLPYAHNSPLRNKLAKPHPSDSFAVAFNQAQQQISLRSRLADIWPLAEIWKDKTKDTMKVINGYIDPILSEALAKKGGVKKSPVGVDDHDGETLLDHLVEQTDGEHTFRKSWNVFRRPMIMILDPVILRDEILK